MIATGEVVVSEASKSTGRLFNEIGIVIKEVVIALGRAIASGNITTAKKAACQEEVTKVYETHKNASPSTLGEGIISSYGGAL